MIQKIPANSKDFGNICLHRRFQKREKTNDKEDLLKKLTDVGPVEMEIDPRQKRCDLRQKAKIIGYMSYRESEEEKRSNLSWFSESIGVSRPTIYKIYNDFKEKFQNETPPGPKPEPHEKIVAGLQEQLREKQEECDILEQILGETVKQFEEDQKRRLVATLLEAAVGPMSLKNARDLLKRAFGVKFSKSKIKKVIAEYSNKAREILSDMGLEEYVEMLAVDEVFAGRSPILTGVEPQSFAVLICKRETSRTYQEWYRVLEPMPHLKLVISDKAKGIIKAVRISDEALEHPLLHQFDVFHFKRDAGKLAKRLEASAYRKIESEYKAEAELEKAKTQEQRKQLDEQYQAKRIKALEAIEIYDAMAETLNKAYEAMEIFDEHGNFNKIASNLRRIEDQVDKLKITVLRLPPHSKNRKDMNSVIRQLQDPRLLLYLTELETRLLNITCRWKTQGMNRYDAVKILCEHWHWKKRGGKITARKDLMKRFAAALQFRRLQMHLANFQEVARQVYKALNAAQKASSLVESFNSRIRIYQQVKKGLHEDFLYLVALKWNLTAFEGGKRKGKSPCEILGVPLKSYDWLELLLSQ